MDSFDAQHETGSMRTTAFSRRQLLGGAVAVGGLAVLSPGTAAASEALTRFRPKGTGGMDHRALDAILARHVKPDAERYNRVDYRSLKAGAQGALKAYVQVLEAARPSTFSSAEAHAYWVNLYNAKTLDVVLDHYPVTSIKRINLGGGGLFGSGPWSRKLMTVEGEALSLDDIEHRIVRPLFSDPMSHYALNCASYSCPNLAAKAYTGAAIARMMDESGRAYVNHPRGVRVSGGVITASRIYSWYAADFGGRAKLKGHWTALAEPDLAARIAPAAIGGYEYDWTLNDVR
jgi:hypothetical protein